MQKASMLLVGGLMAAVACAQTWTPEMGSTTLGDVTITQSGDSLEMTGKRPLVEYVGAYLPSKTDGTNSLVAAGKRLEDYEVYSTLYYGNPTLHSNLNIEGTAYPSFVERTTDSLSMHLIIFDGTYTKGVKLILVQGEEGICGHVEWAKYATGYYLGQDLSQLPNVQNYAIATEASPTFGYGIDQLLLVPVSSASAASSMVEVEGAVTASSFAVKDGAIVTAMPGSLTQQGGSLPAAMTVSAAGLTVAVDAAHPAVFDGVLSSVRGDLTFQGASGSPVAGAFEQGVSQLLTTSFEGCVIPNTRLADVTGVVGWMSGNTLWVSDGDHVDGLFFYNNGAYASCQFQARGGNYIKCVMMELRQVGADIQVRTPAARYIDFSKDPYKPYDQPGLYKFASTTDGAYATVGTSGYCITNMLLRLASKPGTYAPAVVTMKGSSDMTSGCLEFVGGANGELAVTAQNDNYAKKGFVDVGTNATLTLAMTRALETSGGPTYRVAAGGVLRQQNAWNLGYAQSVQLLGGKLCFGSSSLYSDDASSYVGSISYSDGAESFGPSVRVGLDHNARIQVSGTRPSIARHGFICCYCSVKPFTFDISDVTGSPAADFTVTGAIRQFDDGLFGKVQLLKIGPGTMRWEGVCTCTTYPIELRGGVIELGVSNVVTESQNFLFSGGGLAAAANTHNACGTLTLTKSGTLAVGAGADVSFAAIGDWTPGQKLFVTAEEGARVRLGASLPESIRRLVRLNGHACQVGEGGYLELRTATMLILR